VGRVEGGRGKRRRGGVERRLREGRELGGKPPLKWWWDRGCVEFVWGGREKAREDYEWWLERGLECRGPIYSSDTEGKERREV
jgi:hypothetical protein